MEFRLEFGCEGLRLRHAFASEVLHLGSARGISVTGQALGDRVGIRMDIMLPEDTGLDVLKNHFDGSIFQIASTRREESAIVVDYKFCP
jgi:hypothetical protein